MNHTVLLALIATMGTWFLTALGAMTVIFFKKTDRKVMNMILGFAAGVMIAASFWSLLAPAIDRAEANASLPAWLVATLGFLFGALFMWISDHVVSAAEYRLSCGRMVSAHQKSRLRRAVMLMLSITMHNIPEGLAVGVAFGALAAGDCPKEEIMGAVTIAVGIGLQNFPEGAAVSLPLREEGYSRRRAFFLGQASALVEPVAGVIGALLVVTIGRILPYALAFAAGAMIVVAVHELIPECQKDRDVHPYFSTGGIVVGFALMMLLDVALG